MSADHAGPPPSGTVIGFDHVAVPMQNVDAMAAFYSSLGLSVAESPYLLRAHAGDQTVSS